MRFPILVLVGRLERHDSPQEIEMIPYISETLFLRLLRSGGVAVKLET
jgi:hypothetical protein